MVWRDLASRGRTDMTLYVIARPVCQCKELAVMVLLGFSVFVVGAVCNAQDTAPSEAYGSSVQVPTWLWGEWSRDWILEGKVKSNTLDVHYLQTPLYFADIRIPKERPRMST